LLRGARGDLGLIVKQQSLSGFDVRRFRLRSTTGVFFENAHRCQLKTESLEKSRFYLSLDPPRIPLKKGDFEKTPVPPPRIPLKKGDFEKTPVPPPRIPLKKGDFEKTLVPPLLRGARGDLGLIVKQQSL
jgi:hypothetical protein